jgi:hypothetical protein
VPFFLAELNHHDPLACSPEAMQLLLRSSWPGNTEQLWQVLRRVVQHKRSGTIHPVTCRLLSSLESMERDAIVPALLDHNGNKAGAARSLGNVAGDHLPQDPRVRDRHPSQLTSHEEMKECELFVLRSAGGLSPGLPSGDRPVQRALWRAGVRYLVRYQNCGVLSYWVRFSKAVGSVEEMFVFQAQV